MTLELYFHPLSSFCHKVLVALYESGTPFVPRMVRLELEEERTALRKLWPIGKFPVLRDHARERTIPESSLIIEYLDLHHPGATRLIPQDAELAWQVRLSDRLSDLHIQLPMQKIVGDLLRPEGSGDPLGVAQATAQMRTAVGIVDREMAGREWAVGDRFSLADCSACPALFYANEAMPFGHRWPNAGAYLARLRERPSFARVIAEAQPYFHLFPGKNAVKVEVGG